MNTMTAYDSGSAKSLNTFADVDHVNDTVQCGRIPVINERPRIIMVGAFPPPIHGMAAVNLAILDRLRSTGATPLVINVSASCLDSRILMRLSRLPTVLDGLLRLANTRGLQSAKFYMSVSGGFGQIYDIFFASLARSRGMRLFMHHHSFSYLNKRTHYTQVLINAAGSSSIHIVLSERMAEKLKIMYKATHTVSISNAVFCYSNEVYIKKPCKEIRTVGFISNISAEKGVFEFLDLMKKIEDVNLPLQAKLAGPFQDSYVEHSVYMRLARLKKVEYVGPKYGADKDDFFEHIDVFVFPTRYVNEAEPLIVLEAMSHGVPIIAYGCGCIAEIVGAECGRVVDRSGNLIQEALEQIKAWLCNPTAYEAASQAAANRFLETYVLNNKRWLKLLKNILGCDFDVASKVYK